MNVRKEEVITTKFLVEMDERELVLLTALVGNNTTENWREALREAFHGNFKYSTKLKEQFPTLDSISAIKSDEVYVFYETLTKLLLKR